MVALLFAMALKSVAPEITYVSRGTAIGALLKDVSRQTGVAMGAVPETRDEIVIVSLHNAPINEFQTHLAEAIGAQWRTSGGVARLVRPIALDRSQAAAERNLRISEVTIGLEKLRKRVGEQPAFDEKTALTVATKLDELNTKYKGHLSDSPGLEAVVAMEPQTPAGRLSVAAVATLTPDQIADVGPGDRIVYSTSPTAAQRAMPSDFSEAVQRYQNESQLYSDALKRLPVGQRPEYASPETGAAGTKELSAVLLVTERSPYNPNLKVQVLLVRKNGTFGNGASSLLDLGESSLTGQPLAVGKAPLSPQALKFMAAVDQLQKGKSFLTDKGLIQQLTHPEQFDPLSFVAAEGVLALSGDNNVIACLPDSGFLEPAFTSVEQSKTIDLKKFSDWLTLNCSVSKAKGWLVSAPKRMVEARALRVDRAVFGQFLRRSLDRGGIVLDDLAEFASKMPLRYMDSIVPEVAFFVLPDLIAAVNDRSIELLRVYGRLTSEQRTALSSFKPLSVGALDPASIADLNHLIYRADSPISYRGTSPNFVQSVDSEVTTAMPNGVPASATLTINTTANDAVIVDGGGSGANYEPLNANALAYALVRAQKADPADKRESIHMDKYRYGHTRVLAVEIQFTPTIGVMESLKETNFSRKDDSVAFDQLPDAFKQQVAKAMTRIRTQDGGSVTAGGKVPPP